MSNITCPLCGSPVTLRRFFGRAYKPFCTRCGWNLARAESSLSGRSRVLFFIPVLIIVLASVFLWLPAKAGNPPNLFAVVPLVLMLVLGGVVPLWSFFATKRSMAQARATLPTQPSYAEPIPDAQLQRIQSLPRPRRVRLRFTGAFAAIVVVGIFLFIGLGVFEATRRSAAPLEWKDMTVLIPVLFIFLFVAAFLVPSLLKEKRNRPLFEEGEVAAARVLAQRTVIQGNTSYSQIDYEFRTPNGQTIRNSERDLSRKVFEDMLIPVFYDPNEPSRCRALCASYSKLPDAEG